MPALGPVAADHRPGLGLAVALQHRQAHRLEEQADFGLSGAPPETIAFIRPPNLARTFLRRVSDRMPSIGRSSGTGLPHSAWPRSRARGPADRPCSPPSFSTVFMILARSISNSRGTTTMIVGCTSSMLAASFSRLLGVIDLRAERDREVLAAGMLIGVAGRQEGQEDLVVPAEVGGDDVDAAFDIVQDHAVVLHHAARRAAGAAGVDDAGEVFAPDLRHALLERADVRSGRRPARPNDGNWATSGAWPVMMSSIEMTWWHSDANSTAGISVLGQLLGRDDHRAGARIAEDMLVIAGGVGGVGRNGDAAGGHDAEVGDQPFRPVLADQHAPGRPASSPMRLRLVGQRRHLPRRLVPADRLPLRRCAWPTGTACRPSPWRASGTW